MSPAYLQLAQHLKTLGYEPVGIQFETNALLELLFQVFQDPRTHNRQITYVYTGLQMTYDKNAQSLTVGGMTNIPMIVAYIQKNVPMRPKDQYKTSPVLAPTVPASKPLLPALKKPVKGAKPAVKPATKPAAKPVSSPTPTPTSPFIEVEPPIPLESPEATEPADTSVTPPPPTESESTPPTQEPTTLMPEESISP